MSVESQDFEGDNIDENYWNSLMLEMKTWEKLPECDIAYDEMSDEVVKAVNEKFKPNGVVEILDEF